MEKKYLPTVTGFRHPQLIAMQLQLMVQGVCGKSLVFFDYLGGWNFPSHFTHMGFFSVNQRHPYQKYLKWASTVAVHEVTIIHHIVKVRPVACPKPPQLSCRFPSPCAQSTRVRGAGKPDNREPDQRSFRTQVLTKTSDIYSKLPWNTATFYICS